MWLRGTHQMLCVQPRVQVQLSLNVFQLVQANISSCYSPGTCAQSSQQAVEADQQDPADRVLLPQVQLAWWQPPKQKIGWSAQGPHAP